MKKERKEYCLFAAQVIWADEAKAKYGRKHGEVVCPDCQRTIKLHTPPRGQLHLTQIPRHLKNAA